MKKNYWKWIWTFLILLGTTNFGYSQNKFEGKPIANRDGTVSAKPDLSSPDGNYQLRFTDAGGLDIIDTRKNTKNVVWSVPMDKTFPAGPQVTSFLSLQADCNLCFWSSTGKKWCAMIQSKPCKEVSLTNGGQLVVYDINGGILWSTPAPEKVIEDSDVFGKVAIGKQTWMKRNLEVTTYRDGTPIPEVKDPNEWANLKSGAWCYYDNDPANGKEYGKLYNWYALNDPRGLAPKGWHIPDDVEWKTLTGFLGSKSISGEALKETGASHWYSPNSASSNSTGFTGLPGGYRLRNGKFNALGGGGYWWSSTEMHSNMVRTHDLHHVDSPLDDGNAHKLDGFSVRCVAGD